MRWREDSGEVDGQRRTRLRRRVDCHGDVETERGRVRLRPRPLAHGVGECLHPVRVRLRREGPRLPPHVRPFDGGRGVSRLCAVHDAVPVRVVHVLAHVAHARAVVADVLDPLFLEVGR